jgi:hypothetical protein
MQIPMPQPIQNYGSINEAIQAQPSVNQPIISDVTVIVGVNGCPICRIGVLEDDYRYRIYQFCGFFRHFRETHKIISLTVFLNNFINICFIVSAVWEYA